MLLCPVVSRNQDGVLLFAVAQTSPGFRCDQQIARDAGDDVLGPDATVGAGAVATVLELPLGVVGKHNELTAAVLTVANARLWVGQLAPARQLQLQEGAVTFESNCLVADDAATLVHR